MNEYKICELCDNYTEHDFCVECGEDVCQICEEAYGCPSI